MCRLVKFIMIAMGLSRRQWIFLYAKFTVTLFDKYNSSTRLYDLQKSMGEYFLLSGPSKTKCSIETWTSSQRCTKFPVTWKEWFVGAVSWTLQTYMSGFGNTRGLSLKARGGSYRFNGSANNMTLKEIRFKLCQT